MKRIIPMICAVLLMTLFVVNSSAQSFGTDESLIPYLNYTLSADDYTIHSPSIESSGGQFNSWVSGVTGRIDDVAVLAGDIMLSPFGEYIEAEAKIYYDFVDATVDGEVYRPTTFDISYSPFTIKYGDAFQYSNVQTGTSTVRLDSYTFYEAIGAVFEWYGAADAYVEGELSFRLNYVKRGLADSEHNVYEYQPLTCLYRVSFGNVFTNGFYATSLSLADMSFYNVTDDVLMTFNEFHNDIVSKTGVLRTANNQSNIDQIYLDVERCNLRINVVNAPFSGLIQPRAPYIDIDGYEYVNGLYWNSNAGSYTYRQQYRGNYVALITADVLNRRELSNIQFGDDASPIVRVPALFLSAVSAFFDIDFFGLGFTIGNLIGVVFLASVVLIFLKIFAGG